MESTPSYAKLAAQAVHKIGGGHTVFAGQRLEGFYVDLGSIFDLGDLRPFQNLHLGGMAAAHAVNATHDFSVHTIALKIPKHELTRDGSKPTDPMAGKSVIAAQKKLGSSADETGGANRRRLSRRRGSSTRGNNAAKRLPNPRAQRQLAGLWLAIPHPFLRCAF